MGKALDYVAPVVGGVVGNLVAPGVGGAYGAALGSGAANYSKNHNIGSALLSAGGTFAGSQIAGNLLGDKLGSVGSTLSPKNAIGPYGFDAGLGATANNVVGSLANAPLSTALGGFAGNSLASGLVPETMDDATGEMAAPGFSPSQEKPEETPFTINALGSLSPEQQSSNIASEGVYGGGAGPQESSYFLNLLNRRLVDDSGRVDDNLSEISPVENTYLGQLGLGGYDNPSNLLEAINKWRTQQAA